MTVMNREIIRDEIATSLATVLVGTGLPVSAVYNYRKGKLNGESPVVLVISGNIDRTIKGVGAKSFFNSIGIEIHILVYDGDVNPPLTEAQREDKLDEIEQLVATWVAANQIGSNYIGLAYAAPSERASVTFVSGGPYQLEINLLQVEAPDK